MFALKESSSVNFQVVLRSLYIAKYFSLILLEEITHRPTSLLHYTYIILLFNNPVESDSRQRCKLWQIGLYCCNIHFINDERG